MSAPCLKCGVETDNFVELAGLLELSYCCCESCHREIVDGLEAKRKQFDVLIEAGVPRDKANEIMINRMSDESSD